MEYLYESRCELPDFAALAVLESQHCPLSVPKYEKLEDTYSKEYKEYMEQTCTSRYRILHILDAASDAFKKEYIEAKEKPVFPYYRHRPMLIFGKHKNGTTQIEGREETREYFEFTNSRKTEVFLDDIKFSPLEPSYMYALHSIGTPYYDVKNFDRLDTMFYADYLQPRIKFEAEAAGKNFGELLLRLIYNRTPIKAAKIKNTFAALGTIKNARLAGDSGQPTFYELRLAIETVIKNDAKIDSNAAIYMDKTLLPPDWRCPPEIDDEREKPFYFFGDLKGGNLVIDSLASTRDAFVLGDTIYDISMGIPFEELVSYFLPSNMSLEELKLGNCWDEFSYFSELRDGIIPKPLTSKPDSLIKAVSEIAEKWAFFDNKDKQRLERIKCTNFFPSTPFFFKFGYDSFRCRGSSLHLPHIIDADSIVGSRIYISNSYFYPKTCEHCKIQFNPKYYGVWGK
jgi:hypothetical protein